MEMLRKKKKRFNDDRVRRPPFQEWILCEMSWINLRPSFTEHLLSTYLAQRVPSNGVVLPSFLLSLFKHYFALLFKRNSVRRWDETERIQTWIFLLRRWEPQRREKTGAQICSPDVLFSGPRGLCRFRSFCLECSFPWFSGDLPFTFEFSSRPAPFSSLPWCPSPSLLWADTTTPCTPLIQARLTIVWWWVSLPVCS